MRQARKFVASGVHPAGEGSSQFGNMPLVVLTAARHFTPRGDSDEARELEAYYQYRVYRDQPRMLALSTCARQVLVAPDMAYPRKLRTQSRMQFAKSWPTDSADCYPLRTRCCELYPV